MNIRTLNYSGKGCIGITVYNDDVEDGGSISVDFDKDGRIQFISIIKSEEQIPSTILELNRDLEVVKVVEGMNNCADFVDSRRMSDEDLQNLLDNIDAREKQKNYNSNWDKGLFG